MYKAEEKVTSHLPCGSVEEKNLRKCKNWNNNINKG